MRCGRIARAVGVVRRRVGRTCRVWRSSVGAGVNCFAGLAAPGEAGESAGKRRGSDAAVRAWELALDRV